MFLFFAAMLVVPLMASNDTENEPELPKVLVRRRVNSGYSFRFRLNRCSGASWSDDSGGWCLECQYNGVSGSACSYGDKLVIDRCGSSSRQRFIYEESGEGKGRFKPQGSQGLCVTREGFRLRLRDCNGDEDQVFRGFHPDSTFELRPEGNRDYCVGDNDPVTKDEVYKTLPCGEARDVGINLWKADDDEGFYNGYTPGDTATCSDGGGGGGGNGGGGGGEICGNTCVEASQNGRVIGKYRPVSTKDDIVDFYDYEGSSDDSPNFSFNGDNFVPLVRDGSHIFIHQDSRTCQRSLAIVHDSKKECSGGIVRMFISGDLEDSIVQDGRDSPSDWYRYSSDDDETECYWKWSWQSGCKKRTDGIAHIWDNDRQCLVIRPKEFDGIDDWLYVPGPEDVDDEADPDDYVKLDKDENLYLCRAQC